MSHAFKLVVLGACLRCSSFRNVLDCTSSKMHGSQKELLRLSLGSVAIL